MAFLLKSDRKLVEEQVNDSQDRMNKSLYTLAQRIQCPVQIMQEMVIPLECDRKLVEVPCNAQSTSRAFQTMQEMAMLLERDRKLVETQVTDIQDKMNKSVCSPKFYLLIYLISYECLFQLYSKTYVSYPVP
jgi:hypothetical protein